MVCCRPKLDWPQHNGVVVPDSYARRVAGERNWLEGNQGLDVAEGSGNRRKSCANSGPHLLS